MNISNDTATVKLFIAGAQITVTQTKEGADIHVDLYGFRVDDIFIVPKITFTKSDPPRFPCAVCRYHKQGDCCKPEAEPCPNGMGR